LGHKVGVAQKDPKYSWGNKVPNKRELKDTNPKIGSLKRVNKVWQRPNLVWKEVFHKKLTGIQG